MRDNLTLYEIESILRENLEEDLISVIMVDVKEMAEQCMCAARSYYDCSCGAWTEDDISEYEDDEN